MRKSLLLLVVFLISTAAFAQFKVTSSWTFDASQKEVKIGDEIDLIFKVKVIDDWYIYSSDLDEDTGPVPTTVTFENPVGFEAIGDLIPVNPKKKYDDVWEADVTYFVKTGVFRQKIKILSKDLDIKGILEYQTCTDVNGQCIPGDQEFDLDFIKVSGAAPKKATPKAKPAKLPSTTLKSVTATDIASNPTLLSSQAVYKKTTNWTFDTSVEKVSVGDEVEIIFKVDVKKDWYIYGAGMEGEVEDLSTKVIFEENDSFTLIGGLTAEGAKEKYEDIWEANVRYFEGSGEFRQKIKVLKRDLKVTGLLEFQTCTDVDNVCIRGEKDFTIDLGQVEEAVSELDSDYSELLEQEDEGGLWAFFIAAFLFGIAGLLTPCVFPMIPMTVAFFTNSSQSKKQAKTKALGYGLSIVLIYIVVGVVFAAIFGAEVANDIATGAIPNIIFFTVFVIFAISFFGYFEINIPTGFVNKMDRKVDKGGFVGVFFMAFTLVLVSFSCTGPIVGTVLIQSFQGEVIKPVIGMLGFSLAFAIPFTIFAFFPGLLKDLPKSGGWLNSVKVVLGFIELALGFKFLSIADQAYHWGLLDREIYLAIWFVLAIGLALYLLGVIRFPHDSKGGKKKPLAIGMAVLSLAFAVYLFTGFREAPLNGLAGYLPPEKSTDFSFQEVFGLKEVSEKADPTPEGFKGEVKYADLLELPHGLKGFFDYDQAMAFAKEINKPLFIDFTGHGCVNCRKMEQYVWSDEAVLKRLNEDYVVVALYIDERTLLPESEWYTSENDGKVKKTIGKQNFDFQYARFGANAQPYYILLDNQELPLLKPRSYEPDVDRFVNFLDEAKIEFQRREKSLAENR